MKGLTVFIFKSSLGDCTNGGISATRKELTIIGKGISGPFEPTDERPAVCMGEARGVKHLRPADPVTGAPLPGWYMHGGNIASCSDARFPHDYPLKIHDRLENYD